MIRLDLNFRDYIYNKIDLINTDATYKNKLREGLKGFNLNLSEEIDNREYKTIRVSQLPNCKRKEFFRVNGISSYIEPESFITFQIGTDVHRFIQLVLMDELESYEGKVEKKVNDNYRITGHYDGIIKYNGGKYVLEFKTMSPYALEKVLKEIATVENNYNDLNPSMSLYRYLQQGNTYIYMLNSKEITGGYLILINKAVTRNAGALLTIKFDYDKNLAEQAIKTGEEIIKSVEENIPPEPSNFEWECRYCGYYNCEYNKNGNRQKHNK